jgi:hypothetical protein
MFFVLIGISCAVLSCAVSARATAAGAGGEEPRRSLVKATGTGYISRDARDPRQAKLLARRAAIIDGYRKLSISLGEITTYMNDNDAVVEKSGFIRGAKVLGVRYLDGGKVEADVGVGIGITSEAREKISGEGHAVVYSGKTLGSKGRVITKEEWVELTNKKGVSE